MNLIVAVDRNWGIGRQDQLLFRISDDMKRFRSLTLGKVVILGRRTLQAFPGCRPLEKRMNIVLTRRACYAAEPAIICHSLEELGTQVRDMPDDDLFVIGGATVYRQLLPFCKYAYVTKIDSLGEADCFFPDLDADPEWELVSCESGHSDHARADGMDEPISLDYSFCLYRQASPRVLADA